MENKTNEKIEIKISKSEEEEDKENNKNEKNNSYSKITNITNIENDQNDNDIDLEVDNDIFEYYSHEKEKENELTELQIERLNKIREEAQMRSEKYSELSANSNLIIKNTNNLNNSNNIISNNNIINSETNDAINSLSHQFINHEYEENQNNEINPNLERKFDKIHPYLYINGEPLILIGPDILYFIIMFTFSSFLSIIFYSLKSQTYFIMKMLFLLGYLFYSFNYILLMILNPGIPKKKNHIELEELKKNYNQCQVCNCIFYKNNDFITFHCHECNICIEDYDHHCSFMTKCIGNKNKIIFKLWILSMPIYIIIIFFYIIL